MNTTASVCYRFTIGRFECFALSDGVGIKRRYPFLGSVRTGLADGEQADERIPTTSYLAPRTSLLVRTPGKCVLIDTGIGSLGRGSDRGCLVRNLPVAGVSAGDVETVILTHAHLGHAGGALDATGRATYPAACYTLAADEWKFWMAKPDLRSRRLQRMADRISAGLTVLQDRVALVVGGDVIVPGIRVIAAPGHSAGHLAISITSEDEELVCLGDVVLAPDHLEHPAWYTRYDLRPEQSVTSRIRLLDRVATSGALVHGYHFPFPGLGRVRSKGRAWRWESHVAEARR
jgi:glyoxylase-like metal-dependent hydrolase (beta-lactamase superfamily II)